MSEANSALLHAVAERMTGIDGLGSAVVTRVVVVCEAMTPHDEYPSVCTLAIDAAGSDLVRWQAIGLMRVALINAEYGYTHGREATDG